MIDGRNIAMRPVELEEAPVTTAVYTLQVVMNEENAFHAFPSDIVDEEARRAFADEFQRALDDGYFVGLRYDALDFEVVSRIPVSTQKAEDNNDPD